MELSKAIIDVTSLVLI